MTSTTPTPFDFNGSPVRVVPSSDGQYWFVASDIAAALGYRDASRAVRSLDDDEKGAHIVVTPGGPQEVTTVSESGMYSLILRSRKPSALAFKKWVTGTVLPTLRQHGLYVVGEEKPIPEDMTEAEILLNMAALRERLLTIEGEKLATARRRHLEARQDRDEAHQDLRRILRTSYSTPAGKHTKPRPKSVSLPKRRKAPAVPHRRPVPVPHRCKRNRGPL